MVIQIPYNIIVSVIDFFIAIDFISNTTTSFVAVGFSQMSSESFIFDIIRWQLLSEQELFPQYSDREFLKLRN
jgi:hypothetical protein